jgi:hypothetical protein
MNRPQRQRHLRSELGDGDAAVALQGLEDAAIEAIKVLLGGAAATHRAC